MSPTVLRDRQYNDPTLGNLLQRPPTAINGGAGLCMPPSTGAGVRAALEREVGASARDGAGDEEPQILRLG